MYQCVNCKMEFDTPDIIYTTYEKLYGLLNDFDSLTPYEYKVCPYCQGENFEEKGECIVERKIIDLKETDLTFEEVNKLSNYIWKNDELIPAEMIEGE